MSPDTWSFSLAKFLELTFHGRTYRQLNTGTGTDEHYCKHSLFQDHYQYFRYKNIVTVFSTSKISIRSLHLPPVIFKPANSLTIPRVELINETKDLYEKRLFIFSTLVERITNIKGPHLNERQLQKLDQFIMQINTDSTLKHKFETINLILTNQLDYSKLEYLNLPPHVIKLIGSEGFGGSEQFEPEANHRRSTEINYDVVEMLLIDLKKFIAASVVNWNARMSEFFKKTKFDDETNGVQISNLNESQTSNPIDMAKQNNKQPVSVVIKEEECVVGKQLYSCLNENNAESGSSLLSVSDATSRSYNDSSNAIGQTHLASTPSASNAAPPTDDEHSKQINSAISLGKRFIANLIPSSAFKPLTIPFPDEEHYNLTTESNYYVNDKNVSSIVAFTLSSKEYKDFQSNNNNNGNNNKIEPGKSAQLTQSGINSQPNLSVKENFMNNTLSELEFNDSTTKFYCKVYYAEMFSDLRKLIMPNDEERFIHSLFRCVNWDAKGGKSNSQFRKTINNRFVLKEMSKQEVQSFLDFAPHYVQYISNSIQNNKATALAKILGAYRICMMKNTSIASKAVKMDVIVMENLFCSKKVSHVFDLKGSERNRMVNVPQQSSKTQEKDLVLLDENFLRWSFDNQIYIKPHSKYVLMNAIEADAEFLSSKFVMDYSLLCGFDQTNNEVVVGIIDYLRVFTWDKKVETYIKTISGQGKMPTIVSPDLYRKRFVSAINRYFLDVPDQWYQERPAINIGSN